MPDSPDVRDQIKRVLRRYDQDTISNPVPGIYNALRYLQNKDNPNMRMGIYVFGDEFVETADSVIRRLDELNPADENGVTQSRHQRRGFSDHDPVRVFNGQHGAEIRQPHAHRDLFARRSIHRAAGPLRKTGRLGRRGKTARPAGNTWGDRAAQRLSEP
jgi:hypothetical protein